ncbi:MAG: hypothetical protein QXW10_03020 [Candidatus Micrarchaeaceae archaeon]
MARMVYSVSAGRSRLIQREQLLVLEIGRDAIDSASAFVEYISSEYGFSKSSVWYNLNRLKDKGIADFASKEDVGKPLMLTPDGLVELQVLEPLRGRIAEAFSMQMMRTEGNAMSDRVVRNIGGMAMSRGAIQR